jgi:hypothetical protein
MKPVWLLLVLGIYLTDCSAKESGSYIRALSETIRTSERIVVTEHSSKHDLWDSAAREVASYRGGCVLDCGPQC